MSDLMRERLAELSKEVGVVDLHERVLRGSRRITRRNQAIGLAAVAIALTGVVTAFNAVKAEPPFPPAESPSPSLLTKPPPTPSTIPSQAPSSMADVRNATFAVPAFPGVDSCSGGKRKFTDGRARIGDEDMELIIADQPPARGNVDGAPGDEILIDIVCKHVHESVAQVLALRPTPAGGYEPIGYVVPAGVWYDHEEGIQVEGSQVRLPVVGSDTSGMDKQIRRMELRNGTFVQVSGANTFPPLIEDVRQVDWRNATFGLAFTHGDELYRGFAKVDNGTGEATLGRYSNGAGSLPREGTTKVRVTVEGFAAVADARDWNPNGSAWVLVTLRMPDGEILQRVYIFRLEIEGPRQATYRFRDFIGTGRDSVTAIEKVEAAGGVAKVTVMTGSGRQTWSYEDRGNDWRRIG